MNRRNLIYRAGVCTLGLAAGPLLQSCASGRKNARAAWEDLRLNRSRAFDYVHPERGLPKVLLYGDSISIGYTSAVREALAGQASVFRIFNNGQSSNEFIPRMERMEQAMFRPHLRGGWDFAWDVIHFNVGLHDLKYVHEGKLNLEKGTQVSGLAEYRDNLDDICRYLQQRFPLATLIFATTTPVPENCAGRRAGDAARYNTAAREVLKRYPDILINDLYAFTLPHHAEWMVKPGDVHYNETGKTRQGEQVARCIADQLNPGYE